jgi:hypothetical protein
MATASLVKEYLEKSARKLLTLVGKSVSEP